MWAWKRCLRQSIKISSTSKNLRFMSLGKRSEFSQSEVCLDAMKSLIKVFLSWLWASLNLMLISTVWLYTLRGISSLSKKWFDWIFRCQNISDFGLSLLSKKAEFYFPQLEKLDVRFASCKRLTDPGIKDFATNVGDQLPKLTELSAHFNWHNFPLKKKSMVRCEKLTRDAFLGFHRQIFDKLIGLKTLTTKFSG